MAEQSQAPADLGSPIGSLTIAQLAERIAHERESRQQQAESIADAQALRAIEIERRLQQLNGEYGRINSVLATTVPREVFEAFERTLNVRLDVLERAQLERVTREAEREQQIARREQERDRNLRNTMAFVGLIATAGGFLLSLVVSLLGIGG